MPSIDRTVAVVARPAGRVAPLCRLSISVDCPSPVCTPLFCGFQFRVHHVYKSSF